MPPLQSDDKKLPPLWLTVEIVRTADLVPNVRDLAKIPELLEVELKLDDYSHWLAFERVVVQELAGEADYLAVERLVGLTTQIGMPSEVNHQSARTSM